MFVKQIAEYAAMYTAGTMGTDVFIGHMPPTPDDAMVVIDTGGATINKDIAEYRTPTFQIICRSATYTAGRNKMQTLRGLFHCAFGIELQDFFVMTCHAQHEPQQIGKDENGRFEFSCNFYAQTRPQPVE